MTKVLTGRRVFVYAASSFGVILAANLTLAFAAIDSFPGIEVRNGYIASQSFEAERAAQMALGWAATADYADGQVHVAIRGRSGKLIEMKSIALRIGRPTSEANDIAPEPAADATGYVAAAKLTAGLWRVDILAEGPNDDRFRQQLQIEVRE